MHNPKIVQGYVLGSNVVDDVEVDYQRVEDHARRRRGVVCGVVILEAEGDEDARLSKSKECFRAELFVA
jgi:hypothetical protein